MEPHSFLFYRYLITNYTMSFLKEMRWEMIWLMTLKMHLKNWVNNYDNCSLLSDATKIMIMWQCVCNIIKSKSNKSWVYKSCFHAWNINYIYHRCKTKPNFVTMHLQRVKYSKRPFLKRGPFRWRPFLWRPFIKGLFAGRPFWQEAFLKRPFW